MNKAKQHDNLMKYFGTRYQARARYTPNAADDMADRVQRYIYGNKRAKRKEHAR